jgi:hypothetical protein
MNHLKPLLAACRRLKTTAKATPTLALVAAVLVSLGQPCPRAFAQKLSGDDFNQHLIDTSNRTLQILLEIFRPHVAASKRDLLNKDRINVKPLAGFNAYYLPDKKEIQIPFGIVYEIHLQAHAYVYTKNHPASGERYNEWLQYLAERSQRVAKRFKERKTDVDDEPIQDFWRYAGFPAPELLNGEDADIVAKLMLESLGLVLAHEIGHLVFEHLPYDQKTPAQARKDEQEADDFGADLVRKAGGSAIPGLLTSYVRFAAAEELSHPFDKDKSTHPRAMCRTAKMLKSEFSRLFKSEDEQEKFFRNAGIPESELRDATDTAKWCEADSGKEE